MLLYLFVASALPFQLFLVPLFFLWSSLPDDDLLNDAARGRLHEPAVVTLDLGLPPDPDGTSEGFATLKGTL